MTLDEAVAILNLERHNGRGNWEGGEHPDARPRGWASSTGARERDEINLTEFEAVAIAKEYRRACCMTLEEAVAVLNAERHSGQGGWYVGMDGVPFAQVAEWEHEWDRLSEFEAIAVAMRYVDGVVERALVA